MKIKPQTAIAMSIGIVLTGIIATSVLGFWTTQSTKVPQKFEKGQNSGQYNPADIRGSYTFSEISDLFQVPIDDLANAFLVEKNATAQFKCKDLETVFAGAPYEIGTGSVRMFVTLYLGLPFESTEETYLPEAAIQILKEKSNLSQEKLAFLEDHAVAVS